MINETCLVVSRLQQQQNQVKRKSHITYKITFFEKYDVKIVFYGSKPSSRGSHVSVMFVDPMDVI